MSAFETYQRIYELEAQVKELEEQLEEGTSTTEEGDNFLLFLVAVLVLMNVDLSDVTDIMTNSNFVTEGMQLFDVLKNLKV
ncbi:hypothetical protein [Halobacillus sp. A5]|uniref:hypothetical protein n=1 Tax=Halobacillus sp. A5 TaxID=2880263 RepID=UPI0020A6C917|nr:hypothetical protein [Halobacillus sp. A5]MCP3028198.1 hypothetical protein [Halobacillus sp. A5]